MTPRAIVKKSQLKLIEICLKIRAFADQDGIVRK